MLVGLTLCLDRMLVCTLGLLVARSRLHLRRRAGPCVTA